MSTQTPAAGWYPDGTGVSRWWDGTSWTPHVQAPGGLHVDGIGRLDAVDATTPHRMTGDTTSFGSSIVPGGIVRTPRTREGGKQILIGLALLAAFAVLTVGSTAAAASGASHGGGRVFLGAAGVGALLLLRGLSARYSSTPVVLLGFVGIAALVAVVMLAA